MLPEESLERLRSIADRLRARPPSAQNAGPSDHRKPAGPVLFLGAAGTGKTMAARIVAADAGVPVHQFDLGTGLAGAEHEFERLAARAFQAAARDRALLVIDGAQALMRSSPRMDWHGRAASGSGPGSAGWPAEANGHDPGDRALSRLLRRADRYEGQVVFTSTMTHGIDTALTDRFEAVVTFPLPEVGARKEIWRRSLPADARLTENNLDYLAGWLQWPGGAIHRCGMAAADEAVREGVPLQLRHVAAVLDQETGGAGRPARASAAPGTSGRAGPRTPAPGQRTAGRVPALPPVSPRAAQTTPLPALTGDRSETVAAGAAPTRVGNVRRWPLAAVAVAVVALAIGAIVVLLALGSSGSGARKAAYVDALRVSLPSGWRERGSAAASSLGLPGGLVVSSPAPATGDLVIAKVTRSGSSPLPQTLTVGLPATATPQIIKLGPLLFYRYLASPPQGSSGGEWIYAMPTTTGTVIGVCRPQGTSAAFAISCERVLGTLRLRSGRTLPLTLSTRYARELNAVMARLNAVRSSTGPQLAAATSAHAQSAAAAQLARAHQQAASALTQLDAGVAATANAALAHALLLTASAYTALAHAAAHNETRAYATARSALARSGQELNLAFGQLRRLGYQVA